MINDFATTGLQTRAQKILLAFNEHPSSVFHLTGSRFFGNPEVDSDFDFMTEDSESLRGFLSTLGFELVESCYNKDKLITGVYRLPPIRCKTWDHDEERYVENPNGHIIPGNEGFDVQLTSMLDSKLLIQKVLKTRYVHGLPGTKVEKTELWNLVAHALVVAGVIKLPD